MDLEVDRNDLHRARVVRAAPAPLDEGQARLRVDAFGLSSNNITYAVFGDALRYWDFFPAHRDAGDDGGPTAWGRIPVWGFAEVVESRCPALTVGRRVFGYLPMSDAVTVVPGRFDDRGFSDVAPHRAEMAAAYSRYTDVDADPVYRPHRERHQMVLYPLFFTAFLIDDFLADHGDFGAAQLWISSASAKTSIGTAYLASRRNAAEVVGLTSERNRAFVESLGVYDRVVTYDAVAGVATAPAVFVDVAGNSDLTFAVHAHLGDRLAHSMIVGGTHWDHRAAPPTAVLAGPTPEFFFAPSQVAKRTREWGQEGLDARLGEAWDGYAGWVDGWVEWRRCSDVAAVEAAYRELLDNAADPHTGYICSFASPS